jgi:hypothetical protein
MSASSGFNPPIGGGWVVDESLLRFLLDLEIHKAQRLRYSISLVCLAAESATIGTGEPSPSSLAASVGRHIRSTDAVAPWACGWIGLLLIDAETVHLPRVLDRLTVRLEAVVWSAGGSSYPRTAGTAEDMLRQAVDLLRQAKQEGGNRLYVAS